jgi:DNA-binding SARP family transcriptional activator
MPTLHIRLFGALSIDEDNQQPINIPGRRVRDLLAYLVITRETRHQRDHLAGLFWGDLDDLKARHCLNTTLWRLNRVLQRNRPGVSPYLLVDSRTIGLNPHSDIWIDVDEFESLCQLADQVGSASPEQQCVLYSQAISHYRGHLLTDTWDDWCMIERERLHRIYTRVLFWLMRYHAARSQHDQAIAYGHQILAQENLYEEVHRELMLTYLAAGDPAAALRQYRHCEELLRKELGIAPMPETRAVLQKILEQTSASTVTTKPPVADVTSLQAMLAEIRETMAEYDVIRLRMQHLLESLEASLGDATGHSRTVPTLSS